MSEERKERGLGAGSEPREREGEDAGSLGEVWARWTRVLEPQLPPKDAGGGFPPVVSWPL